MAFVFGNMFGNGGVDLQSIIQEHLRQQQERSQQDAHRAGRIYRGGVDPRSWIQSEQRNLEPATVSAADDALRYKEEGNLHFRAERFDQAAACYTQALQYDSENAVLYSNRSAAFLKMKKTPEALVDADHAIQLRPEWSKAHLRRGNALFQLNRIVDALAAFTSALKYATDDKEKEEINVCVQKCESRLKTCATPMMQGPTTDPFEHATPVGGSKLSSAVVAPRRDEGGTVSPMPPSQLPDPFTFVDDPGTPGVVEDVQDPVERAHKRRKLLKSLSSAATKLDHVKIICEENESVGGVSAGSVLAGDFDKETEVAFRAFTGAQTVLREKATGDSSEEYMQALQERNAAAQTLSDVVQRTSSMLDAIARKENRAAEDPQIALALLHSETAKPILSQMADVLSVTHHSSELDAAVRRTNSALHELRAALEAETACAEQLQVEERAQAALDKYSAFQKELEQTTDITAYQEQCRERLVQVRSLQSFIQMKRNVLEQFNDSEARGARLLRDEADLESQRLLLERRRIKLQAEMEWKKVKGATDLDLDKRQVQQVQDMISSVVEQQGSVQNELRTLIETHRPELLWKAMRGTDDATTRGRNAKWIKGSGLWLNNSLSDFHIVKLLHTTHESKVYHVTLQGQPLALKEIVIDSEKARRRFQHEIAVVSKFKHPGVIGIKGMFFEGPLAYIVMPFYPEGSMKDFLASNKNLPLFKLQELFRIVLSNVAFIHDNGIIHRDLKPSNILMEKNASNVVICDFGIAKELRDRDDVDLQELTNTETTTGFPRGTTNYMSPEVFSGQPGTYAADLWSLGIMFLHTVVRNFDPEAEPPVLMPNQEHITVDPALVGHNDRLANMLEMMLTVDPQKRPTAHELLVHPFFTTSLMQDLSDEHSIVASDKKISAFTSFLNALRIATQGPPVLISISRERIMESVESVFREFDDASMLAPLFTVIRGEEGIDEGGVTSDMLMEYFTKCVSMKSRSLLVCEATESTTSSSDSEGATLDSSEDKHRLVVGAAYLPNTDAMIPLSQFQIFGKVLLKALILNRSCPFMLSSVVTKFLCGASVTLQDLEEYDATMGKSLRRMLLYSDDELKLLELDFGGLMPDGENTAVTVSNVRRYVELRVQHILVESRRRQLEAIKDGFMSCKALESHLSLLSATELSLLMCGNQHIQPDVIIQSLKFSGYPSTSQTPDMLKELLRRMTQNSLRRFLRLCTSNVTIPHNGLARQITVMCVANTQSLPVGHTCGHQLDLPDYNDADVLKNKLYTSLAHVNDGFGFV